MGQRARRQLAEKQFGGGAKAPRAAASRSSAQTAVRAAARSCDEARSRDDPRPGGGNGGAAPFLGGEEAAKRLALGAGGGQESGLRGRRRACACDVLRCSGHSGRKVSRSAADVSGGRDRKSLSDAAQNADPQHDTARNGKRPQATDGAVVPSRPPTAGNSDERVVRNGVRFRSDDAAGTARDAKVKKPVGGGGCIRRGRPRSCSGSRWSGWPAPKGAKVVFQDSD